MADFSFLPFLIQETLYLVDKKPVQQDNTQKQVPHQTQQPVIQAATNEDKVLFLILDNEFIAPAERDLLLNLVKTTNIAYAQVSRTTLAQYKPTTLAYPHYFLIFTRQKPPFILGEKYSVFEKDQKKMLWADTLADLCADKQKKALLWVGMKKMFGL